MHIDQMLCLHCTDYSVDSPAVRYGQLLEQELDEELALSDQRETTGKCSEGSSELLEEGGDEEAASFGPRLLHTYGRKPTIHLQICSRMRVDVPNYQPRSSVIYLTSFVFVGMYVVANAMLSNVFAVCRNIHRLPLSF